MNSVPKLFSCSYADCWTENHFSTEFGVSTPNYTHSHTLLWGCVSRWFGRALAWHARGHRFDPGNLHQKEKHRTGMCGAFLCPFRLAAARQSTFPKGTAFRGSGKLCGIAIRRPLGGAGALAPEGVNRLRGSP